MEVKGEIQQAAKTVRIHRGAEADSVEKTLKKLREQNAFTLAEMLITVLILLMVSGVVAGGVPAAANAYRKAVDAANAYSLLSTTVNALRDELSTAWDVSVNGTTITYYSSDTGSQSVISVSDNVIMLQQYNDWSTEFLDNGASAERPDARPLVTDAAKIKGKLKVIYDAVKFDPEKGIITFTGLGVTNNETKSGQPIVKMPDIDEETGVLQIRVITGGSTAVGDNTGGNTP